MNERKDLTSKPEDPGLSVVPRYPQQGYAAEFVAQRRKWLEERTGAKLDAVGKCAIDHLSMKGNIENPIGSIQMPLGIAGPIKIDGEFAKGVYYVPLATTEGALVRSYERGMTAITRAGGAVTRISKDENQASPIFTCQDVAAASKFAELVETSFADIKAVAEGTTNHGKLIRAVPRLVGRDVVVDFGFSTGDAHGMNMIAKATDAAGKWLSDRFPIEKWYVMSGGSSEKRPSGRLFAGGKGKYVTAGARLSPRIAKRYLHVSPAEFVDVCSRTLIGQTASGVLGYNGHFANGLTALFIATGQDVANIVNSAVGIMNTQQTSDGDLYVGVTLPSLTIATVGGGTGLATSAECLDVLGCRGTGKSKKLAEIVAATVLAGELSFGAALASGEFVDAHEQYGRNRT